MKRITTILFWSVISAAFIGPGTVTTAASAGASHGFQLLWALVFSTLACVVLQEAAARISIVSGKNLGEALKERYKKDDIYDGFRVYLDGEEQNDSFLENL